MVMAYEDPMDAARRRAGLKPMAEALAGESRASAQRRRENIRPGEWRKRQEIGNKLFPGTSRAADEQEGWVYIAGAFDREKLVFVKIGFTAAKNPNTRIKAIAQGTPHKVRLLAAIGGDRFLELQYHREFAIAHVKGEWFEPSPDVLTRVKTINSRGDSWRLHWGKRKPR